MSGQSPTRLRSMTSAIPASAAGCSLSGSITGSAGPIQLDYRAFQKRTIRPLDEIPYIPTPSGKAGMRPSEYVTATQTNVHHIPSQELASVHAMGTLPLVPVMVHAQSRIVRLER